jgi:hypothetical protein
MGKVLQMTTGFVTAPGATLTPWTMAAGDTLAVRSLAPGAKAHLVNVWADNQATGSVKLSSPLFHDDVTGITAAVPAATVLPLLPQFMGQELFTQDVLTARQSGSAVAGDIESASYLIYYDDVLGGAANLKTPQEVFSRKKNLMTVYNTLALGILGGYSGEETIIAEINNWKPNTDYALLGYNVNVDCCSVGWRGDATSNFRLGGPGNSTFKDLTANWFVYLSQMTGRPCIPVFNTSSNASILIDGVQDENGVDTLVTSFFLQLA